ncbi:hypothetical protein IWZ00DRAFT_117729 [Phyllosticta capitalensis]|uniref:PH domain-containing protein n=1 Tax=Phyllosticta capitalensis TaxID=121624 RepID=A0ABR1YDU9_9PEZI
MPRPRVLSFMSQWGGSPRSKTPAADAPSSPKHSSTPDKSSSSPITPPSASSHNLDNFNSSSPTAAQRSRSDSRPSSRPISMVQTHQPPVMDVAQDTLPELQRIFQYLNSHSNKLYQEGYFLKLHDLDGRGRPSPDRNWTEVFAQLVGTVLSVWDAQKLDEAGTDGEVVPSFINLADASIKMIESLPMSGQGGQNLTNVLSVSTAGNNRYLFHFNSLNSLTQWTAGIRLAMFEHASLQEAYTGSLIAAKGKFLNNIRAIMEKTKFKQEDWARVRFGAGTPWRRCWCVITPPDEKDVVKAAKSAKKSVYDRQPILKGDVKFYDTRKVNKKTRPIATLKDAYSAYAIYPQSKPLIDQSTLVKLEGRITIHSKPESTTEGFVFVMPEVHPAVSGFEMMLRFLFPVFDVFAIYGRPSRLIADPLDTRSLMFAMPTSRRYGYLDILDVASLIHAQGSSNWTEREWRKQLKDLTVKRMTSGPPDRLRQRSNTASRVSLPPSRTQSIKFGDQQSTRSSPGSRNSSPPRPGDLGFPAPRRAETASPAAMLSHSRSVSEAGPLRRQANGDDSPPRPPAHRHLLNGLNQDGDGYSTPSDEQLQNSSGSSPTDLPRVGATGTSGPPPTAVQPPHFGHAPGARPRNRPQDSQDLRRAQSYIDEATLQEMQQAHSHPLPAEAATMGAAAALAQRDGIGRPGGEGDRAHAMHSYRRSVDESRQQWGEQPQDRLPTIPASPYVPQGTPQTATSATFSPTGPPVPEHKEFPSYFPPDAIAAQANHGHVAETAPTQGAVARKPLPGRSPPPADHPAAAPRPPSRSSVGSFQNDLINPDLILGHLDAQEEFEREQEQIEAEEAALDNESTGTPDYASIKSVSTEKSVRVTERVERPRTGRLKMVGNVPTAEHHEAITVGDAQYSGEAKTEEQLNLPRIDFGPTYDLTKSDAKALPANGHAEDAVEGAEERSTAGDRMSLGFDALSIRPGSSGNLMENGHMGRASPGAESHRRANSRSPQEVNGNRRSLWQPQPAGPNRTPSPSNRMSFTPEEWVNHRASLAAAPQPVSGPAGVAHGRHKSTTNLTPPISRNASGDWSQILPHYQRTPSGDRDFRRDSFATRRDSRTTSMFLTAAEADRIPRPNSRNAASMLLSAGSAGLINADASQLTAREQEHVARLTGTPLIDMTQNPTKKKEPESFGLVSAIAARQKEKESIKQGSRSALVHQAIQARQLHAHAQAEAENRRKMDEVQRQAEMRMQKEQAALFQQQMQMQQQMQQAANRNSIMSLGNMSQMSMPMQPQGMQSMPNLSMMGTPQPPQHSPMNGYSPGTPFGMGQPAQNGGGYFAPQHMAPPPTAGPYMNGLGSMTSLHSGAVSQHGGMGGGGFTPLPYGASWDRDQAQRMGRR